MKFDARITFALIAALFFETAGALVWAGRAAARLDEEIDLLEVSIVTRPMQPLARLTLAREFDRAA
jgi:phage head maturation protease